MKITSEQLQRLLKREGGYVNHKDDNGGMTIFGISRKFNPNCKLWSDVDKILAISNRVTDGEATVLYFKHKAEIEEVYARYAEWIPESCPYKEKVFDFSVNAGVKNAKSIFYKCMNEHEFKTSVVAYYKKISLKYPMFKRGWTRRLRLVYADHSIIL